MTTYRLTPELQARLEKIAALPRAPIGVLDDLAERYGYAKKTLSNALQEVRTQLADDRAQDGAAGVAPARVCGPERAGAISGHDAGGSVPPRIGLGVSSLHLGARGESRAVAPAAGAAPPAPCGREGEAPAAVLSPGLCWARAAMARGVPLDKLLRTAGDRLGWRERDALRAAP